MPNDHRCMRGTVPASGAKYPACFQREIFAVNKLLANKCFPKVFTASVVARKRVPAATWSSVWYLLSSFAVISYTNN